MNVESAPSDNSEDRAAINGLYEIDEFGDLTQAQKQAIPDFFRITPYGTKRTALEGQTGKADPSPEVKDKIADATKKHPIIGRFVSYVNNTTEGLTVYITDDSFASRQRVSARTATYRRLRNIADDCLSHGLGSESFMQACEAYGRFLGSIKSIEKASEVINLVVDTDGLATDLTFQAAGAGLTDAQQRLLIEVGKALTVVRVVIARIPTGKILPIITSLIRIGKRSANTEWIVEDAMRRKRNHYIPRLHLIALAGLRENDAAFAPLALDAFKDEFV